MYNPPTPIIKRVGIYMSVAMPMGREKIRDHLQGLEATRYELAKVRCDWLQMLHEKKNQMLHPKDKDLTELDRKTMVNASVAVIERDYEFLCKLEELVKDRIELGKIFLTVVL
jgi:hypothetical protein